MVTKRIGVRAAAWLCACLLAWAGAGAAPPAWVPNETVAAPQFDLLDPEYSQSRGRVAWVDSTGNLWLAAIDRSSGLFVPSNGKGVLVDANAMTAGDLKVIGNGPEWLVNSGPDQIVYTKFLPGQPHNRASARLALAAQKPDGSWSTQFLGNQPRNAPYASKDPGDASPRISYVDPAGNHYWRDAWNAGTETLVAPYPASYYSMRFVQGQRAATFFAPAADGSTQAFRYWLDSGAIEQLTFDGGYEGTTNVPWMWQAPDFGNDDLLATLAYGDTELRVYRKLDPASPVWTVIYTASAPDGGMLGSPEPFVHNGRSYLFMHATAGGAANASRIYLSNVDAANPMFRQLTPDTPNRTRRDPEVFVTSSGPRIYYNRFVPSNGWCPACSEGIYMTDTGLGPAAP